MIELTFNASFAATLRNCQPNPVVALPADLQFGDLGRLAGVPMTFYAFKAAHLGLGRAGRFPDAQALAQADAASLAALRQAVAAGAALRLWWTDVADDVIGRYWLAAQLANESVSMTQVHIPTALPRHTSGVNGELYEISDLGGVDPLWLPELSATTTPLTGADLLGYRYGWHSLLADNGALRVLLNGRLLTVPETFHDWALQERLVTPPRTFAARVRLIGELMGEYPVGVPDWWWAARLDALLAR